MKFIKKKTFYPFPVYEWNLPAGHTCPSGGVCKILVDRDTGKFNRVGDGFRCYAASSERFPAVRQHRWNNYEFLLAGGVPVIPLEASHVRIHGSGDFFSQEYFDMWLDICENHTEVTFWAFTKSLKFWINKIDDIPDNLTLQASKGGLEDYLIDVYNLKYAQVFTDKDTAMASGLPIDYDDTHAMNGSVSFALLDNFKYKKTEINEK